MIAPVVVAVFFAGLLTEATVMFWLDRRAIRREAEFWEELKFEALDGYGRLFDWDTEGL